MLNFNVITPSTVNDLLIAIENNKDTSYRFGAGYTDLLLELKKQSGPRINVINLAKIEDPYFALISRSDGFVRVGTLVTANELVNSKPLQELYPVLHKAAYMLASRQIRQVATVGGNICTASPAGDITTALVALDSRCEIMNTKGAIREIAIQDFLIGVRRTDLKPDEVLRSVLIPINSTLDKVRSDFVKIGSRKSMECSIISLAYHFYLDSSDIIRQAGVAIGSAAPTIKFTRSACDYIIGKNINQLSQTETEQFAKKILEYASPISDIRGSAWYRSQVLYNISMSIFEKE